MVDAQGVLQDKLSSGPSSWNEPCSSVECTLHQISPYIGKLKSSIAGHLIDEYSKYGDLVVDPFAGSGTVALEAALRGRRVFASDTSPYAKVLSLAKLKPPPSLTAALAQAERALKLCRSRVNDRVLCAPPWVRSFFHPRTLREAVCFAEVCRESGNNFLLACLLGILHHERPGFLSYPSSHLVPYLRSRKYPRRCFPQMYRYREVRPRIIAKIERAYRRFVKPSWSRGTRYLQSPIEAISLPPVFDALITSPPYMNALDYGRDNRLRLWFIDPSMNSVAESRTANRREAFIRAITTLADKVEVGLRGRGYCVIVVGEATARSFRTHPSKIVLDIFADRARTLRLKRAMWDDIPDIRRARREYKGVKRESFLIFQKV